MKLGEVITEHEALEELYEEMRGMAGEYNVPVWTASQAGRSALEDDVIDEIGDVKWRLELVEKYYDSEMINERINYKKNRELEKK